MKFDLCKDCPEFDLNGCYRNKKQPDKECEQNMKDYLAFLEKEQKRREKEYLITG